VFLSNKDIMLRTLILLRQAGNVSGSISFLTRSDDITRTCELLDYLKCDLGDLLLQTEMLIKDLKLDIDEIKLLAYDRYDECKKEFRQKGKSQYFV